MESITLIIWGFLLSLLPFGELRAAIPIVISQGLSPQLAFVAAVLGNILIIPIIFLFLDFAHTNLLKYSFYENSFNLVLNNIRKKEESFKQKIAKYGFFALTLFVAIPLPISGAYSGTLIAWTLNLDRRKSLIAMALGVVISGLLISFASVGAFNLF